MWQVSAGAVIHKSVRLNLAVAVVLLLTACTPGTSGIMESARYTASRLWSADLSPPLQSGIDYLRIRIADGRVAFLALGYVEGSGGDETEVWYSAEGEVLKLRGGRIVATLGLSVDWRRVVFLRMPAWMQIGVSPLTFERERDVMPGYRFNIREKLTVREIPPPAHNPLSEIDPAGIRWFEENTEPETSEKDPLPPARYAIRMRAGAGDRVEALYGEQCLSIALCFSWEKLLAAPKDRS